jgi:hypothetical protein
MASTREMALGLQDFRIERVVSGAARVERANERGSIPLQTRR